MSLSSGTKYAVTFLLLGALSMLALVSIAWGVWQLAGYGGAAQVQEVPPASVAQGQPADAPDVPVTRAADPPLESHTVAAEPGGSRPPAGTPDTVRDTAPLEVAEAPSGKPEAAEVVEDEADEKARREEQYQRELDYMEKKFDKSKVRFMEVINTYLDLPMEERPDYLRQAMEDLRLTMEAEREADGMPAKPARDRRLFGEMMRMSAERLDEDEKTKVTRFMADVMQMHMARLQTQMEEGLKAGQGTDLAPPAP